MQALTENMKYYAYYLEAYTAVLGGMVSMKFGSRRKRQPVLGYQIRIKSLLPLLSIFSLSDYDDFGVFRSCGFKRRHLGHDMMGQVEPRHCRGDRM